MTEGHCITLEQQLSLEPDVINGFSYSFTKALLAKLKELEATDRIFEGGAEKAEVWESKAREKNVDEKYETMDLACSIITYLEKQLSLDGWGRIDPSHTTPSEIRNLIALTEEFLQVFQKK